MKIKFYISLLVIFLITIILILKPGKNLSNTDNISSINTLTDSIPFIIGAYADGEENDRTILFDSLKFNLWHSFTGHKTSYGFLVPQGWSGRNDADSLYYTNNNTNPVVEDILNANGNNLRTLMQRPKLEWLFFAQRSDYQCVDSVGLINPDFWFYAYNFQEHKGKDITDNSNYGNGVKVRYCQAVNPDGRDSGYIVKNLIANREQINTGNPKHDVPYPGFGDVQSKWYIKPRIRIDSVFANNPANNYVKVCRIEILRYDSTIIGVSDIKVINFKQSIGSIYNGDYIEIFNDYTTDSVKLTIDSGKYFNPTDENWMEKNNNCKVDFRVFWYDKCDMWIERVRVDNDRANDLFGDSLTNITTQLYNKMIQREASDAKNINNSPLMFYIDEFEFNHIPAISYVMKKLQQYAGMQEPPFVLSTNNTYNGFYSIHMPQNTSLSLVHFKQYCLDDCRVAYYGNTGAYPFVKQKWSKGVQDTLTKLPNTLPVTNSPYFYATLTTPNIYENWLQGYLMNSSPVNRDFIPICKDLQQLTIMKSDLRTFFSIQTHAHNSEDYLREPTNEEIRMMVNTSVSYGVKGIMYYSYDTYGMYSNGTINPYTFSVGLMNRFGSNSQTPRYYNFYGQKKWESIINTDRILKKWSPYLRTFTPEQTHSYVYNNENERNSCNDLTFFNGIFTNPPLETNLNLPSLISDDPSQTYIQAAVFNSTQNLNYFMLVNRRCSPFNDTGDNGGRRFVKIRLDTNNISFNGFNNWKIIDLKNDSTVLTFDKRTGDLINLGWYMPAEGKLYKIVPVMIDGGSFVCEDSVTNIEFTCKGTVNTNGHNLIIQQNTTINFKNNCGIIVQDCEKFYCGAMNTILQGVPGEKWNGITFSAVGDIQIAETQIKNIYSGSALNIYNSPIIIIVGNQFILTDGIENASLNAITINNSQDINCLKAIYNNTIAVNSSTSAIIIVETASASTNLYVSENYINNYGNSQIGIFVSNGSHTDLLLNNINNFSRGLMAINSNVYLRNNSLSTNRDQSIGIYGLSLSQFYMNEEGETEVGNENYISDLGDGCTNIKINNSSFDINYGRNKFNIKNIIDNYHFYGNYINDNIDGEIFKDAKYNCFQINGADNDKHYLLTQNNLPVTLIVDPYYCSSGQDKEIDFIVPIANNLQDTVYKRSGSNNQNMTELMKLKKGIYKNIRFNNFDSSRLKCTELLTNYPDSINIPEIISKLYLSTTTKDSSGVKTQQLKTYLEQLIMNNSQKVNLVKSANYFAQKCKVFLKQYASALIGFEDIIIQNPYSYEGLIASWDYAATALLIDTTNGSGGMKGNELSELTKDVFSSTNTAEFLIDSLRIKKMVKYDRYDKSVFTVTDRNILIKSTGNVLFDERDKQIKRMKELEIKSKNETGKEGISAKNELGDMKALNEAVKTKRPKSRIDYVTIVNDDIKKVFRNTAGNENSRSEIIPKEFSLYQNYPNPFNPITKISFDLPKDSKVKLIVYDILGREVTRLLNSEFKQAGKHIIEFDAMKYNLASGVYFYRIDSGDFNAVKKMLMIK